MPDDITDAIAESAAAGIAAHAVDGESTTAMSINDQIAADKYLTGKTAAKRGMNGLLRQQMKAPNALGE